MKLVVPGAVLRELAVDRLTDAADGDHARYVDQEAGLALTSYSAMRDRRTAIAATVGLGLVWGAGRDTRSR